MSSRNSRDRDMGVSKNRGTPKWMVYNGKPYQNGWFGGPTPIFGNTHIVNQTWSFGAWLPKTGHLYGWINRCNRPYQHLTKLQSRQLQLWWCVQEPHWWPQQINDLVKLQCDEAVTLEAVVDFFCFLCIVFHVLFGDIFFNATARPAELPDQPTTSKYEVLWSTCWAIRLMILETIFRMKFCTTWDVWNSITGGCNPSKVPNEHGWLCTSL